MLEALSSTACKRNEANHIVTCIIDKQLTAEAQCAGALNMQESLAVPEAQWWLHVSAANE